MTDDSVIEEAAKAIAEFAAHDGPVDAYHLAKVLYARFEKAHTPSDDERDRKIARLEADLGIEIDRFEQLHEMADRLSLAIAPMEIIGEHSSANDPWRNALEHAETRPRTVQGEPTDAEADAAGRAIFETVYDQEKNRYYGTVVWEDAARAALRAAYEARGEGL